jgi:hypothetical protein
MDYILDFQDYNIADKKCEQQICYKRRELDDMVLVKIPDMILTDYLVRQVARYLLVNSIDWIVTNHPEKDYYKQIIDGLALNEPYPYTDKYNKIRLGILTKYQDMFEYSDKLWFISEDINKWIVKNAKDTDHQKLMLVCCSQGDEKIASSIFTNHDIDVISVNKDMLRYLLVRQKKDIIDLLDGRFRTLLADAVTTSDAKTVRWVIEQSLFTKEDIVNNIVYPWRQQFNPYNIIKETYQEIDYSPVALYLAANALYLHDLEYVKLVNEQYGIDFMANDMALFRLWNIIYQYNVRANGALYEEIIEYLEEITQYETVFLCEQFLVTSNDDVVLPTIFKIHKHEMYSIYSVVGGEQSIDYILPKLEKHYRKTMKKSARK